MTFISIKRNGAKTELEEDCAVQHCPDYTISKVNVQKNKTKPRDDELGDRIPHT